MPVIQREYMCKICGKKVSKSKKMGEPQPGICPRQGKNKPHIWTVNREFSY